MTKTFSQLGLPDTLADVLRRRGFEEPFPVQAATIPDAMAGRDVCGKAPTGSGKTLAFGLPVLAGVGCAQRNRPRALMLAPTRELAEQIKQELAPLAKAVDRSVIAIYGGVGYGPQKNALRKGVDVLVATPGRLEDLIEQSSVDLRDVDLVVVDEADRMADMGFLPAVRRILDQTSKKRQTLLFSATLDGDIAVLSRDFQRDPARHEAGTVEPESIEAAHHFWLVDHHDRVEHTAEVIEKAGRSIVFTRTRHGADRLAKQLSRFGLHAVAMHGGRSQNQRNRALKEFSTGRAKALIATDVAARGIHVDAVACVIHFDPPADHKDYLHRSGRTARAGAAGIIVSLVTREQRKNVRGLQKDLNLDLPIEHPDLEDIEGNSHVEYHEARPERRTNKRNAESHQSRRSERGQRHDRQKDRSAEVENGSPSVYISNLPWKATDQDVEALFARFGEVRDATIIKDRKTGRSRGFGFVEMPEEAASTAIEALNGTNLGGRDLTVRFARPRTHHG